MNAKPQTPARRRWPSLLALMLLAAGCTEGAISGGPSGSGGSGPGTSCGVPGQSVCGSSCVNLSSDPANCGVCGHSCAPGELCSSAQCACQPGFTRCGATCVDTRTNGAHCGACNMACTAQVCANGTCQDSCPSGSTACGTSCINVASDPMNCGGCSVVCRSDQVCQGACICGQGLMDCFGTCADLQGNGQHCGACGNVCGANQVCSGGVCQGGSGGAGGTSGAGGTVGTGGNGGATGGSGGATGGTAGSAGTSGSSGSGGSGGGGGPAACPNAPAAEFALVSGWLSNTTTPGALPNYAYNNINNNFPMGSARDTLACSIVMSCVEFAPAAPNWLRKCEAVITSAMVAESSYNPNSVVVDGYATRTVDNVTANDPTIGLLQIRFSSTVHDYNYYGRMEKMASIGCNWPAALTSQADTATWWATQGGTTYLSFMQGVPCNIALATWYYLYNATGNGGQNAVWIFNYCDGQGIGGNMVVGLLSHLMGGNFPRPPDANNAYPWGIECCAGGSPNDTPCTGCTGRVAAFLGIGTGNARPNPDPFLEVLSPEPSKYCR
jgi:Stigma-specific protein, Stig1